jgi:hypothetical protein
MIHEICGAEYTSSRRAGQAVQPVETCLTAQQVMIENERFYPTGQV